MDISNLGLATQTSLELLNPETNEPTGLTLTGYTNNSKEWRSSVANYLRDTEDYEESYIKVMASTITAFDGNDNWKFTTKAIMELFLNPEFYWVSEQWSEHLSTKKKLINKPLKSVKNG